MSIRSRLHAVPIACVLAAAAMGLPASHAAAAPGQEAPRVTVDMSQVDAVQAFARKAGTVARTWYPRIEELLGVQASSPAPVRIVMDMNADGVAGTAGREIRVSTRYVAQHPDDVGLIVHELVHVVQAYPKYDAPWLVEGIADYVRFFHYEPASQRPHPNPDRADCRASYRTTGAFLDWASRRYDQDLVKKLNAALHAGTYTDDLFKQLTGKGLDALNAEWKASLRKPGT